jgi:hypothetical protein
MQTAERVSPAVAGVFPAIGVNDGLTDLYISQGRIGRIELRKAGCYTWHETLRLVASELWRRGEADAARVTLKAGRQTVREFLRTRFGIVTGAREFWYRENWTPDRADLCDFLGALRDARPVHR